MLESIVDNQVEEIKKKIDIVNLISGKIPLKKRGRHFLANCPFHGEKTPSFIVSPELQIYKCFGCGKGGDAFSFLMEYDKIDFREALEILAKTAGVTLTRSARPSQEESLRRRLLEINIEVARFYHYLLVSHPVGKIALDYVLNRGITPATIKQFQIGFAPSHNPALVNRLIKKGYHPDELVATGTFGQDGRRLYDRFGGRLIFPLSDYRDRILGFSGRILPATDSATQAKYINSPETVLYHKGQMVYGLNLAKEAIRKQNAAVVVEGEFDMISPFQFGFTNFIALKGTAFTPDQLQLLKRYTDTLILALDSDFAGNNAAIRSIELADSIGFDIKVLMLDDRFKDPDDAVRADPDYFRQCLGHPLSIWDFIISSAVKNHGIDSIRGRKLILETTLPVINKIGNSVIRSDYLKKLAQELNAPLEAILQESQKHQLPKPSGSSTGLSVNIPANITTDQPKTEKLEEFLLILILAAKKPSTLIRRLQASFPPFALPKFDTICQHLARVDEFIPSSFADSLPAELQPIFQNLYLVSTTLTLDSHQRQSEIKKIIRHLKIMSLRTKISQLSGQIGRLESLSDSPQLSEVEKEYTLLLQQLSRLQTPKS